MTYRGGGSLRGRPGRTVLLALVFTAVPARGQTSSGLPFGLLIGEQSRTSFTLVGAGARASGMGGAFTAVADDATAASFNPAGLAQLMVPEASVVFDAGRHRDEYAGFVSFDQVPPLPLTDSAVRFDRTGFNFASATLPFRLFGRRFAVQLSAQRLVDFTYSGARDFEELGETGVPLFGLHQASEQSGSIRLYSGSLAMRVTERTLLGVTVNRWDGAWSFTSVNAETPLQPGAETESFTYSQTNELKGWNVDLGLLLKYPRLSLGVRWRLPFDARYGFESSLATNIPSPVEPLPPTQTTLHWPGTLNVGASVRPAERWEVALDWGRTDWSAMVFDVPGSGHVNWFDLQPPGATGSLVANDWRLGTEVLLFAGSTVLPLRAGAFLEPEPARDAVTGDRVAKRGVTLGAGVKSRWLAVDLAVRYARSSGRVSRFLEADEIASGALRATSQGELRRTELSGTLSLIVQIPSGSTASRVLHEIFVGPSGKAD